MSNLKEEILNSLRLQGSADDDNKEINVIIASRSHISTILDLSGGLPKFRMSIAKRFDFITKQPLALESLSPLAIRCCLCSKVIGYPAWYYNVNYTINHFHYFVCFDTHSPIKVTARCYRRV